MSEGRRDVKADAEPSSINRADKVLAWLRACAGRESPHRFKMNRAKAK